MELVAAVSVAGGIVRRPIAAGGASRDSQVHLCPGGSLSGAIAGAGSLVAPTGAGRRGVEAFRTWSFRSSFYPRWSRRGAPPPPAGGPGSAAGHSVSFHANHRVDWVQTSMSRICRVTISMPPAATGSAPIRQITDRQAAPWARWKMTKLPGESARLMANMHTDMPHEAERLQADGARRQTPAWPEMPHVRWLPRVSRLLVTPSVKSLAC